MTAHQKLQLIRHLEAALRAYKDRLHMEMAYGTISYSVVANNEFADVQETLAWVRKMETKA